MIFIQTGYWDDFDCGWGGPILALSKRRRIVIGLEKNIKILPTEKMYDLRGRCIGSASKNVLNNKNAAKLYIKNEHNK